MFWEKVRRWQRIFLNDIIASNCQLFFSPQDAGTYPQDAGDYPQDAGTYPKVADADFYDRILPICQILSSGVKFFMHLLKVFAGNVRIYLCRGNVNMPEHHLNGSEVSTALQ